MKNMLLNHDCLNTWQTCPKKYYYKYIKEIKFPEFHNDYELGKSVHALIDYYLRGLEIKHLLKEADKEIISRWNIIKKEPILNKKIIKTELGLNTPIKNTPYWLTGRIDAVFYDEEENKYIIADWKTGKYIAKNIHVNFQHKIYLYAFYQSRRDLGLDFKPKNLIFKYFNIFPDSLEITEIDFSKEKLLEYEQNFVNIAKNIEKTVCFQYTGNCTSKICEYKKICNN